MNRRDLLVLGAASAATAAAKPAFGQAPPAPAVKKPVIDIYSRQLQWLRTADEVAAALIEMGYEGIDVTVRPYPGHVDPEKVTTDLPRFVKTIRDAGKRVSSITCPITDADSPNAERMLDAAAQLGIHHYWWGTFRYDQTKPIMPQLEALKPRVEQLAKLNAKYKMKAMYHTYSGAGTVGAMVWDLLYVLRNFDPRYVSFHYDLGHMTIAGANGTWPIGLRAAGPYIGGISVKDEVLEDTSKARDDVGAQAPGGGAPPGGPGGAPPVRGGGGGQANPWRVRYVPLGAGMINLPLFADILKEISFDGPFEVQAEYPLGGADTGQDKITASRAQVLDALKRDLLTVRTALKPSGLAN